MHLSRPCLVPLLVFALSCDSGESATTTASAESSESDASGESSGSTATGESSEGSGEAESDSSSTADASTESTDTTADGTTTEGTATTGGDPILDCEGLTFNDSCLSPNDIGCSDYFGDSSIESMCGQVDPAQEYSTTPCEGFEFFVGSCVFYIEAIPNTCYITHVGAATADEVAGVEAFWSNPAVCANWVPA